MIRINAFFQVNAGSIEQFTTTIKPLVEESQKEAGCIAYDLFASSTRADVFMMCETWADAAALEAHEASAHFTAIIPELGALCATKIEKFEM